MLGRVLSFNRINSGRSIPTWIYMKVNLKSAILVSMVSIQADQSRRGRDWRYCWACSSSFNRINSGRSIPTKLSSVFNSKRKLRFNRINSGRSIPTCAKIISYSLNTAVSIVSIQADQSRLDGLFYSYDTLFDVSIVSIQADQSRLKLATFSCQSFLSFNRINSGRSIPTCWKNTRTT